MIMPQLHFHSLFSWCVRVHVLLQTVPDEKLCLYALNWAALEKKDVQSMQRSAGDAHGSGQTFHHCYLVSTVT